MPTQIVQLRSSRIDLSAIDRADLRPTTRLKYKREITNMVAAGINPFDTMALADYASGLKSSRRAFLKSALKVLSAGEAIRLKGAATPENVHHVQAGVYRIEAMQASIHASRSIGRKAHIWLSNDQVREITSLCGDDLEGRRDWIVLSVLLGAGLRREELSALTFDALKQMPLPGGRMRFSLEVKGKGAKDRVVPISDALAVRLNEWKAITGGGRVARALGRKKRLYESMSSVSIYKLVGRYGAKISLTDLAPHDCRRTFAQLAYEAGVPITQISRLLGHENVATTQRYLDLEIDLEKTASDFIPLSVG